MTGQDPSAAGVTDKDLPPLPREVPPYYAGVVLWGRSGDLLLQLRDDVPGISSPGMIGTFGGGGEPGETPVETAVREVQEEIGFKMQADQLIPLCVRQKRFQGPVVIPIYNFAYMDVPEENLEVTEGSLYRLKPCDLPHIKKIVSATRDACEILLGRLGA